MRIVTPKLWLPRTELFQFGDGDFTIEWWSQPFAGYIDDVKFQIGPHYQTTFSEPLRTWPININP